MLIIRLLLLTPGTIQSHPEMGVGIVTKWRYCDVERLGDLQVEITNQISTYLPNIRLTDVTLKVKSSTKELIVEIKTNTTIYSLETDYDNKTLKLLDL